MEIKTVITIKSTVTTPEGNEISTEDVIDFIDSGQFELQEIVEHQEDILDTYVSLDE